MTRIISRLLCVLALLAIGRVHASDALPAYQVYEPTPVIFSDKTHLLVLRDRDGRQNAEEAMKRRAEFVPLSEAGAISPRDHYWVMQRITSNLDHDLVLRIDPSGWEHLDGAVFRPDGSVEYLKPSGAYRANYGWLSDMNPYEAGSRLTPSQFTRFTLHRGEEVLIVTHLKSSANVVAKSFSLNFCDELKFTEMRRFGLYIEGGLLGLLFALSVFGWFSAANNKDKASYAYSVWILIALLQIVSQTMPEGQRLAEFFIDVEGASVGHQYAAWPLFNIFGYAQAIAYAIFASTFLSVREHYPWLQKMVYVYIAVYSVHYVLTSFIPHEIPNKLLWLPLGLFTLLLLLAFYTVAFIRHRQGLKIAKFFMFAIVPYLCFRVIFILGLAGIPSPFTLMDSSGFGLLMQNPNTAQSIGLCTEALIMALAVVSRTRWLQEQLAQSMQEQKSLIENQNRQLEATVDERTRELAAKHQLLERTHHIVIGSVNYASRLQRSQLPRQHRIDGRFRSIGVYWEPRDTIGGDLWWISSSQVDGPFTLAVADCTGHGVPGAMLSLLVSASLERIYSAEPQADPARALMSLDYLVRAGLNQDAPDSESDDGCDAAIVSIDRDARILQFAGAKIGVFQLSPDGQVTRHAAARSSLGYQQPPDDEDAPATRGIAWQDGDTFAIVTDGYTDQPGGDGEVPRSFGYRRLESLLASCAGRPATQIVERMREEFERWQGQHTRRDDVTAVVFTP